MALTQIVQTLSQLPEILWWFGAVGVICLFALSKVMR